MSVRWKIDGFIFEASASSPVTDDDNFIPSLQLGARKTPQDNKKEVMNGAITLSADQTRYHERRARSLSPLSHSESLAAPGSTSQFMPPKSGAAGLSPLQFETQELDVESPSATIRFKVS